MYNAITLMIAVAALVAGIFGALYARKALWPPKRKLEVFIAHISPILSTEYDKFSVSYDGRDIEQPHVCNIQLRSVGRHSISSVQFDQGKPLQIGFGVPIVEILNVEHAPTGGPLSELSITGNTLNLLPSVLAPRSVVNVSVLTNGKPELALEHNLIDTPVGLTIGHSDRDVAKEGKTRRSAVFSAAAGVVAALGAVVSLVISTLLSTSDPLTGSVAIAQSASDFDFYYPASEIVPSTSPFVESESNSADQCDRWQNSYSRPAGLMPVNNRLQLEPYPDSASTSENNNIIEVKKVSLVVYGSYGASNPILLRCSNLKRVSPQPADCLFDLAKPTTIDNLNQKIDMKASDETSYITVDLHGETGVVYEYSFALEIVVDDQTFTVLAGSRSEPLRTLVVGDLSPKRIHEWDPKGEVWVERP